MKRALVPLLLGVVALGLAACGGSHPRVVHGAPPPPSKTELGKLARLALDAAKGAGDAHPTDAIVVPTTRRIAETVDAGSGVGVASTPAYFVVVHGQFKDCGVKGPPGASCPTGTIVTLTIDPRTNQSTDFGVEDRMPDVNKIGTSEPLPLSAPLVTHTSARARPRALGTGETIPGLRLAAVPAGYRSPLSWRTLLDRFRRLRRDSNAPGKTAARLRTVNGAYPAWVLTFRSPGNTSVAVYDLRGRRWTMSFRLPRHGSVPPCHGGLCGWPVNQAGLDAAAGYAERFAGAAHVFTSDRVDDVADRVVLHLAHAPRSVIDALNAAHPETYVIHNDALRTRSAVVVVERALDFTALQSKGVAIVSAWPSDEGRLVVGVTKDIPKAQAYFDATYGPGFVRVVHGERIQVGGGGPTGPLR